MPVYVNIIFSISNILLTLGLAIFASLQWIAVEKQNKQNLFNLRINLYSEIDKITWNILFSFMNIKENINNKQNISNITINNLQLKRLLLKTKQLFNPSIASAIEGFIKECSKNLPNIDQDIDCTNMDFCSVFEKSDDISKIFEAFFEENKL